jgi:TetR/AcrR family transcriptional repressor of nem operon
MQPLQPFIDFKVRYDIILTTVQQQVDCGGVGRVDDKRWAILTACQRLLEDSGSITIDKVASAAGVAKGTVYLYFDSKQELIQQTFLLSIEEISTIMEQAAAAISGTNFERLSAMINAHYEAVHGKMMLLQRLFGEEPEFSRRPLRGQALELLRAVKKIESQYMDVLSAGITGGEFRPHNVQLTAAAIMAMINNLSAGEIFWPQENHQDILPELLQFILQGIAAE